MSSNYQDAVLITACVEDSRLEEQRQEIAQTLSDLIVDVRELQIRMRQGDPEKKAEANKVLADLRYWLKAARETEIELEAIRRRQAGIEDAYGLDLCKARDEIGCRMARLRACYDQGDLSE
ncbi:hypothetical protein [Tropicibacter naphthalenivorans]|uniref:Uncharacterized protein n=1 Tax=Tropicibacter naphthalenivorans TaxID=441103 RepID=A0A0P1GF89_9RHOB|nr:hypothetical protein [Tropicibacter naphthalenivorans]CUH80172.1 hypothetical protein TRN7648_02854 [Tropicibacter naphthalenivorans]SMC84962.1 hypothetical protein SAMN04488093_105123 [Tropicibacter naphthalenivorans]